MKPFERLRRLAADYEAGVSHSRAEQLAAAAMLRARPQAIRRRWPTLVAAGAALAICIVGMGSLADRAVPGQVLYPLDRAYESVGELMGFNQNRTEERLVEALSLLDRGDSAYAVRLVNEALTDIGRDPDLKEYHATVAQIVAQPSLATPPVVTSTTQVVDSQVAPPVDDTPAATSDDQPVVVAAAETDPATTLRMAAEYLLRTVRDVKVAKKSGIISPADALSAATSDVLAAAQIVNDQAAITGGDVAQDGTTTSTTPATTTEPSAATTTTEPVGGVTTTTGPINTSTTTTVPADGSTTTTLPADGSTTTTLPQGPIILPIQP